MKELNMAQSIGQILNRIKHKVMFYGKFKLKARQSLVTNVKLFHFGANKWSQAQKFRNDKKVILFVIYLHSVSGGLIAHTNILLFGNNTTADFSYQLHNNN